MVGGGDRLCRSAPVFTPGDYRARRDCKNGENEKETRRMEREGTTVGRWREGSSRTPAIFMPNCVRHENRRGGTSAERPAALPDENGIDGLEKRRCRRQVLRTGAMSQRVVGRVGNLESYPRRTIIKLSAGDFHNRGGIHRHRCVIKKFYFRSGTWLDARGIRKGQVPPLSEIRAKVRCFRSMRRGIKIPRDNVKARLQLNTRC